MQNLRVFAYIARRYNSAAEATSLLSSVVALAINHRLGYAKSGGGDSCYGSFGSSPRARSEDRLYNRKREFR